MDGGRAVTTLVGTARIGGKLLADTVDVTLPSPVRQRVLYGWNPGGWTRHGQTTRQAWDQAVAAWGVPAMVRQWPGSFNTSWLGGLIQSWVFDSGCGVYIDVGSDVAGVNAGTYDAAFTTICQTAPTDREVWLCFAHEPENKGFSIAAWQQAQKRLAAIKTIHAGPTVRFVPLLMGGTFISPRFGWYPGAQLAPVWFDFDLSDCDGIGADIYQRKWGTSWDTAAAVFQPCIDLAVAKGKRLVVGELGVEPSIGDAARAKFLTDAVALCNTSPVDACLLFESDNPPNGPYNLLPQPSTGEPRHPLAVAAWAGAVQSSS